MCVLSVCVRRGCDGREKDREEERGGERRGETYPVLISSKILACSGLSYLINSPSSILNPSLQNVNRRIAVGKSSGSNLFLISIAYTAWKGEGRTIHEPCGSALGSGIYSDSTSSPPNRCPPPLKMEEDPPEVGGAGGGPALLESIPDIINTYFMGRIV